MNKILLMLLLLTTPAYAANVAICDGSGNYLGYKYSVNTPDYDNGTNIIGAVLPSGVDTKYLKCSGGVVVEMNQTEKDAVDQAEADAAEQALRDRIETLGIDNIDLFTALIKVINVRIPGNPITKQELKNQIKSDLGL